MRKLRLVRQTDDHSCGVACALMLLRYHGRSISLRKLRAELNTNGRHASLAEMVPLFRRRAFAANFYHAKIRDLSSMVLPVMLFMPIGHYTILSAVERTRGMYLIFDPKQGPLHFSEDQLAERWIDAKRRNGIFLWLQDNR